MPVPCETLPDVDEVARALTGVCKEPVSILARGPNFWGSTFPSEVITCRSHGFGELQVVCKYGSSNAVRAAFGHRAGTAYEAVVYQRVLAGLDISLPRFFGAYESPVTRQTWLFIEFLGEGAGVDEATSPPEAMRLAAQWIAAFHSLNEDRLRQDAMPFLVRYNRAYYTQWARRTSALAGKWLQRFSWLAPLCLASEQTLASLVDEVPTVIHGEFTPSNVLIHEGKVSPVDWESAAVGLGEIDLVALIENWPDEIANECETAYQRARWPGVTPDGFRRRLDLAWLYWHFRWLGERGDWLKGDDFRARFGAVRTIGERLALI